MMKSRFRSRRYRQYVASLGCVICGADAQAAHVRIGHYAMGLKPSDDRVVPLCPYHHTDGPDAQHKSNEQDWWQRQGIDPLKLAQLIRETDGDYESGWFVVREAKRLARAVASSE